MKKSFTLIETLITLSIFFLMIGIISGSIFILYYTSSYQFQQALAIAEARKGIEKMAKEIREAKMGEQGSYPIEYAGDKEFIFYADIDNDKRVERVRYFLGEIKTEIIEKECESYQKGGSCSVLFSNFLKGNLKEATLKVAVQGDLNSNFEYLNLSVDNQFLADFCQAENCAQCSSEPQATKIFDVKNFALDNQISLLVEASCPNPNRETRCVDPLCPYSFKVKFELKITQEVFTTELKRGVIKPQGSPPTYPLDQEEISILTEYVRNVPPIFEYFDEKGNKIEEYPARLKNTKVMKIFLVVNVNPNRPPNEYQLESFVFLRNLKE